jgi:hypothetical protein
VVSGTGLITVSGVAAGTSSTATITTTRTGYAGGTATVTQTSVVGAALTPTFGTQTASPGGFQVQITNYSASYTWAGTATASGSVVVSDTGLVTVMGVAYRTSSTATITTTRTGYTGGTAQVTRTCASGGSCAVGDPGPGGGTIFYKDLTRPAGSQYFEVACAGWSDGICGGDDLTDPSAEWGCYETPITGADGTAIGTGEQNTIDITAVDGGSPPSGIAARLANDLTLGDQTDWFLPSKDELNALCKWAYDDTVYTVCNDNGSGTLSFTSVGGFSTDRYWSSSEYFAFYARFQDFYGGGQNYYPKNATPSVRPVRAF